MKPILKDTKVVFGPVRLSYVHILEKFAPDGDTSRAKFMTGVLIPKSDKETLKAIEKAVETAKRNATATKWQGKEPKKLELPLRDGDEKDDEVYDDHYYLTAKCSTRPGVVDRDRNPIIDEEEVYSGMYAIVSVTFYGYDVSGNKGIACGLNNVMKIKDGERLGGRISAQADFEDVEIEEEEDDL